MATFEFVGLGRLMGQIAALRNPDPRPLLTTWEQIIVEDNRRGVLAGTDKDGEPMIPVKYRPKGESITWSKKKNQQVTRRGVQGPYAAGHDNNLTSTEYRRLTGPPLAPRGAHSRVIDNLLTEQGFDSAAGSYYAQGAWFDVVSKKGAPFLDAHFKGENHLPQRDLRGVRPWGRQKALEALYDWIRDVLRPFA